MQKVEAKSKEISDTTQSDSKREYTKLRSDQIIAVYNHVKENFRSIQDQIEKIFESDKSKDLVAKSNIGDDLSTLSKKEFDSYLSNNEKADSSKLDHVYEIFTKVRIHVNEIKKHDENDNAILYRKQECNDIKILYYLLDRFAYDLISIIRDIRFRHPDKYPNKESYYKEYLCDAFENSLVFDATFISDTESLEKMHYKQHRDTKSMELNERSLVIDMLNEMKEVKNSSPIDTLTQNMADLIYTESVEIAIGLGGDYDEHMNED